MSKSGDKIDYSLRIQKSIERKIFGDIIRTLNYFGPIEAYRYIGFGSFYFKDFLMFYEDFNIQNGISIEIDSDAYVSKNDFKECIQSLFSELLNLQSNYISDDIVQLFSLFASKCSLKDAYEVLQQNSNRIVSFFLETVCEFEKDFFPYNKLKGNPDKYFRNFSDFKDGLSWIMQELLLERMKKEVLEKICIDDDAKSIDDMQRERLVVDPSKYININKSDLQSEVSKTINNRYIFNKPYGFIDLTFGELCSAIDAIEWNKDQKNIIWLDYDEFIDDTQLLGLEKCILNSSRGDLIIFSTSMGSDADLRYESFKELAETTDRIGEKVPKKDCDDKYIHIPIRKLIADTVQVAISKKNASRPNDVLEYNISNVLEVTYSDGTPMYSYGIIIYDESDSVESSEFPVNHLKNKRWFPKEDCYKIYVPALTHKEMNAINQLLPTSSLEVLYEKFPFIEKKTIRKYVEIWNYYPHFFEVGHFV